MTIKKDLQKCVTPVLALCWGGKFLKMAFFPSTNTLQRGVHGYYKNTPPKKGMYLY